MSEQENIQIAKKQIAALNARNVDEYLSRVDESCRDGMRESLNLLFAALPDVRLEVEQILASGDFVIVRSAIMGTHKGSFAGIAATNKPVNFRSCNVVELRDGKAIRMTGYADSATLFQQLGVPLPPEATAPG
jgi:predicted ester cyclase